MKTKNIIYILLIALALTTGVYFYLQYKAKKDEEKKDTPSDAAPVVETAPVVANSKFPLQLGSKGKLVQIVQIICGVNIDGNWGAGTDKAVKEKIAKDGIITEKIFYDFATRNINASTASAMFPLIVGTKNNNYVKAIQVILGLTVDGNLGPKTMAAVVKFAKLTREKIYGTTFINILNSLIEQSKK